MHFYFSICKIRKIPGSLPQRFSQFCYYRPYTGNRKVENSISQGFCSCNIKIFQKGIDLWLHIIRDFISITGVDIKKHKKFYRKEYFIGVYDYNGFGDKDSYKPGEFKNTYGFEYGEEKFLMFFHLCGALKALEILKRDEREKLKPDAYEIIMEGIKAIAKREAYKKKEITAKETKLIAIPEEYGNILPIQINVTIDNMWQDMQRI